jgi:hypothetical protein
VRRSALVGRFLALLVATGVFGSARVGYAQQAAASTETAPLQAEPSRPAPLAPLPLGSLPKQRRLDVGAGLLLRSAVFSREPEASRADVSLGVGASLLARVLVLPEFMAGVGAGWTRSSLQLAQGDFVAGAEVEEGPLDTFDFELLALPTWPAADGVRLFALLGLGYSISSTQVLIAQDASGTFPIPDRDRSHFIVPLGLGGSLTLVPNWLSLEFSLKVVPTFSDIGSGSEAGRVLDGAGQVRALDPLPAVPIWFSQSLGLGLLL